MAYDTSKLVKLKALQDLAQKVVSNYATKDELSTLTTKVEDLVTTGGEPNVLEAVAVNGTALSIVDKMVDILIASGTANGTIAVNGTDVTVTGLGALAYLSEVGESQLASDLLAVINGKADAATTLAGYGITDGMTATEIASAISEAIAGADHLKRVIVTSTDDIDLTADDADQYIYMVANADGESGNSYDEYMVINGALEKVGDWAVDLSDYAKTSEVTTAIATALADYATTSDVNSAISTAVASLITLSSLSYEETGTGNVVTAVTYDNTTGVFTITKGITALTEDDVATDDEVTEMLTEVMGESTSE